MKNLWETIKWLGGQVRPFIFLLSIIVIAGTVLSLCGVSMAVISKILVDAAVEGERSRAVRAAILFAVLILIKIGLRAVVSVMSARALEEMSNRMRKRLFVHFSKVVWKDFSKYHSGDVLTRMTSDVGTIAAGLVNVFPSIISLGVQLLAAFVALFIFEPLLAVLAFMLGPAAVLFSRFFGRKLKHIHIKVQEAESTYRSFMHESVQNMLIVKAFCLEKNRTDRVGELQNEKLEWVLRRSRLSAGVSSALSLGYWMGYFLAFGWGALLLAENATTFGTLTAFLQLVEQIQAPFIGLAYTLPRVIGTVASAGRLREFEGLQLEKDGRIAPCWAAAGIRFEDVYFAYERDKPIFRDVSVEIRPGETVALMGLSGAGKTTLVRLLLALIRPESGSVSFTDGGKGAFDVGAAGRSLISYVPQGNTLFSGTVAENLYVGCPDAEDHELESALRWACAWEFVEKLPDGLGTVIGERGLGLSEGQAQRIAIARALLRKVPILILDEATSALDVDTEIKILRNLRSLRPARTCVIITHRPAVLEIGCRILKLEEGSLRERRGGETTATPTGEVV